MDPMSYCPSAIDFLNKKYDVFLSFRGPDVRKTFVDHLSESLRTAGICFFKDDERLERGEFIDASLKEAIEATKIHIPVFSKTYAQSVWCLQEVAHMCRCTGLINAANGVEPSNVRHPRNGLIIPLFYDVKPSDVRYADKGSFAEAFALHANKARHDQDEIAAWKNALHQVSSLSGWSKETTSEYEGQLVKRVVSDVLKTLSNVPLDVPDHPVGLEERIAEVIDLLKIGSEKKVVTVGIWGMGGIGKTALAKAVFNNVSSLKFEASSFVADVREHKLTASQEQILSDLVGQEIRVKNVSTGKNLMKNRLNSIRALIVLDDLDKREQLDALSIGDWFAAESRVIVTTQDRDLLKGIAQCEIYAMEVLKDAEALQLFSWHAFIRATPDEGYGHLSMEIAKSCCGLPLALQVIGSRLQNEKDEICWVECLKELQKLMCGDNIRQRLEIGYHALNPEEKEIFLDIACFFRGMKRNESQTSFWEALRFAPHLALKNLTVKSLLSGSNEKLFLMHDLLRDMGRAIVAGESVELGQRSRLWDPDDARQVKRTSWAPKRFDIFPLWE
eukprot:Gb_14267 [translate_table: standard]